MSQIEKYSASYYILADTDILSYSGEQVAVDEDLYDYMRYHVKRPIAKIDGGHYEVHPEWGIPRDTVAIPSDMDSDLEHVLLAKDEKALDLVMGGDLPSDGS